MSACIEIDRVEALAAGENASIDERSHIDSCASCRARIDSARLDLDLGDRLGLALATPVAPPPSAPKAPDRIGPYFILRVIGEGGFGVVYLAERRDAITQRVAIKVIKPGMDSASVIARFEQERQALAVIDHPNVARIIDAGTTPAEQGARPYFVMEFVQGEPITDYCDRQRLTIRQRLELMVHVCEAIQAAHHKGIIHRDIKPSNILVLERDERPLPKVIDFGVAKAVAHTLTDRTIHTEIGQMVGTPEYMSPEQAEMGATDVDTRTDVYSLGVVLYQLVSGCLPFDPRELRLAGFEEVRRILREVDPPRPSTRTLEACNSEELARRRGTEMHSLRRELRSELDWIPLKAMRKSRAERYASPLDLARDLRNYLEGRPLQAGPVSVGYVLRKVARRHRLAVGAAGAIALTLLAAATVSTIFAVRESRARGRESAARERERAEAVRATTVVRLLTEMLEGVQVDVSLGRDTALLRGLLDATAQRVERGEFVGQPQVNLEMRDILARVYDAIGDGVSAERLASAAVDIAQREAARADGGEPNLARALDTLGAVLLGLGSPRDAEPHARRALSILEPLSPAGSPELVRCLGVLGTATRDAGDAEGSLHLHQRALDMSRGLYGADHERVMDQLANLGSVQIALGRYADADATYVEQLAMSHRLHGDDHPAVARAMASLALTKKLLRKMDEAERLHIDSMAMLKRFYRGDHPAIARALHNYGLFLVAVRRPREAENRFREALEMRGRIFPEDHPSIAMSQGDLGSLLGQMGRHDEAATLCEDSLAMLKRLHGDEDHQDIVRGLISVGDITSKLGRGAEAEPLLADALAMSRRLNKGDHPVTAAALQMLADVRLTLGRAPEAEGLFDEAVAMRRRLQAGPVTPDLAWCLYKASKCKAALGKPEALDLLREADELAAKTMVPDSPRRREIKQAVEAAAK